MSSALQDGKNDTYRCLNFLIQLESIFYLIFKISFTADSINPAMLWIMYCIETNQSICSNCILRLRYFNSSFILYLYFGINYNSKIANRQFIRISNKKKKFLEKGMALFCFAFGRTSSIRNCCRRCVTITTNFYLSSNFPIRMAA